MSFRHAMVLAHRYLGLVAALFLLIAGLTGAVISWDHELDEWLNPHLSEAPGRGETLPALELARLIELRHPETQVTRLPLQAMVGEAQEFIVEPRVNPSTNKLFELGFDQVFVDPVTGEELGKRQWGAAWPVTRENLLPFLYKLHFSLHLPEMFGIDRWGVWILGVIAIGWMIDCFVSFFLTLPARSRAVPTAGSEQRSFWQRWQPAWLIRWGGGSYKLNYDLHRASGLWTWVLLFILAFTSFSLNLYREVFEPLMSAVSDFSPHPFSQRHPAPKDQPVEAKLDFDAIIERAEFEARTRGWQEPLAVVGYARQYGIYFAEFHEQGAGHGSAGVGHPTLFFDSVDGRVIREKKPWHGTAADIFVQAQLPLHSGRILGLPGRILISFMGLVVAMLSVTGVYLWWKKRRARKKSAEQGALR